MSSLLLFFVFLGALSAATLPYRITPPSSRIKPPCWLDIDGVERVAIYFEYALRIDRVLLAGEESVGFHVSSHSLYLEPSFVQRLEYQCKDRGHVSIQATVNATHPCSHYFGTLPALSPAIPLECYNSTYINLVETQYILGNSAANCSQLIETHCLNTSSRVTNTTCPAVFNYPNGDISQCAVWCRCPEFKFPLLGAPPPGNCTDFFLTNFPPFNNATLAIFAACGTLVTSNCVQVGQPSSCSLSTPGIPCQFGEDGQGNSCCYCLTLFTQAPTQAPLGTPTIGPTRAPTVTGAPISSPSPTAFNCTNYFITQPAPFADAIIELCRATQISTGCGATAPQCPNVSTSQLICKVGAGAANQLCCYCVTLPDPPQAPTSSPAPTRAPSPGPTLLNCTFYYVNFPPNASVPEECFNTSLVIVSNFNCVSFSTPPPNISTHCNNVTSRDFGSPCALGIDAVSNQFCCRCFLLPTPSPPSLSPTRTPTSGSPAPTGPINCTFYYANFPPSSDQIPGICFNTAIAVVEDSPCFARNVTNASTFCAEQIRGDFGGPCNTVIETGVPPIQVCCQCFYAVASNPPSPFTFSPTSAPTSSSGSGLTSWEIFAIVIGVLAALVILGLLIAILCIRTTRGTAYYR